MRAQAQKEFMWQFLKDGGPIMFLLIPTSIVGLTFIIERGLALRWKKVIPLEVEKALDLCRNKQDLTMLHGICHQQSAPLSRLRKRSASQKSSSG